MTAKYWLLPFAALPLLMGSVAVGRATQSTSTDPPKAQVTILYDAFGKSADMQEDWGYAALIEYDGKRILFDTGNNPDILARNAKAKAVDLSKLDFVVMSHRHGDHMGGLTYVLKVILTCKSMHPGRRSASMVRPYRAVSIARILRCPSNSDITTERLQRS